MVKKRRKFFISWLFIFITPIIIILLIQVQYKLNYKLYSLTYNIVQEASWNNGVYANSHFRNFVSKEDYLAINIFKKYNGNLSNVKVTSFTVTSPKVYIFPFVAIACYDYECQYYTSESNDIEKIQCTGIVAWQYKCTGWKVINYTEEETDELPQNISHDKLIELTYKIMQEACWSCSNYKNSQYSELITEENYSKLSIFHNLAGEIDSHDVDRFAITDFEINYTNKDTAVVYYILLDDYGYSNYTVCWNLQEDSIWRIVNVDDDR